MFGIFNTTRSKLYFWITVYTCTLLIYYLYSSVFHTIPIDKVILGSDMEGYYQYLPHFFLRDWELFNRLPWALQFNEGKTLSVFTCGVALLWAPFFLMAHFISLLFQLDADGYANIYFGFVLISAIFYVTIGLNYLYKILRVYFNHKTSLLAILVFPLLTNLFYYTLFSPGMAHAYSFSMIAIFIYNAHRFFRVNSFKNALFMAIPFALAVLIRPTNIIAGFYIFLFNVSSLKSLRERFVFWINNYSRIILLFFVGLLVFAPQMIYWYHITGNPFFYSYQNYGFPFLAAPQISTVLFGIKNGWLFYTPIVNFGLLALIYLLIKGKFNSLAVFIILLLSIYINASWWAPTFSAAVGQRAMIDFLPFLGFAFAFLTEKYLSLPGYIKILIFLMLLILIFFNIQFAFKYEAYEWWDKPFSWGKLFRMMKF